MFIRTAIIPVILSSTFITVTAFAQSTGQPGGGPIRLSDLGCGPGEIARVNGADEWECSDDLSTNEATAAEALSTARQALNAAASPGGFVRTIIVSPLGPSAVDNGGELLAAIDIATNAVPPPSAENPILVALEPGVYDVGSDLVYLVPNVGLRGSGKGLTRIVGRAFSDSVECRHWRRRGGERGAGPRLRLSNRHGLGLSGHSPDRPLADLVSGR